jgi:hypothetical protein
MAWFVEEAIKQCIKTSDVYADAAPMSGHALAKAIEWLKIARRIRVDLPLIPHHSEERHVAMLSKYACSLNMPTKYMLIEYEHGGAYEMADDLTRALATRRIALCVDLESERAVTVDGLKNFVRDPTDQGAIMIWPLTYFDEKRDWEFSAGAAIIPKHQALTYLENKKNCAKQTFIERLYRSVLSNVKLEEDMPLTVSYQEMLPELCFQLGEEHKGQAIRNTAMDDVWVALGVLAAMQCENVQENPDSMSLFMKENPFDSVATIPIDPFNGAPDFSREASLLWHQQSRINLG